MKIIVGKRGVGKTTALIELSAKTGGYIVCRSQEDASRIFGQAQEMKLNIPLPITYYEFYFEEYYAKGIRNFLIDDIDVLLAYLTSVPILAISINMNEGDEWLTLPSTT